MRRALPTGLSIPRPAGSCAATATADAILDWLTAAGVPPRVQTFVLYPHFFTCVGGWLFGSRALLAYAALTRRPRLAIGAAALGLLGGTLDVARGWPLITWPGRTVGRNILLEFGPADAARHLLLAAHYDSKTELLDHALRGRLTRLLPHGLAATAALGLLAPLDAWLARHAPALARLSRTLIALLALPLTLLAAALGANLALGRLARPSSGAVDNGAACQTLLLLAERLRHGPPLPPGLRLTLALFDGEEVNMQGSRAYLRGGQRPDAVINLELMGQDGGYVLWQRDGTALRSAPTDAALNTLLRAAVTALTGTAPAAEPLINSDGGTFLLAKIPTAVLGTRDALLGVTGMHRPTDSPDRVITAQIAQHVELLAAVVQLVS